MFSMTNQMAIKAIGERFTALDVALMQKLAGIDPADPASVDDILAIHELLTFMSRLVKDWKAASNDKFAQVIDAQGDVECGDKRYYVGQTKRYKIRQKFMALAAILDKGDGDLAELSDCLVAEPFKHGAIAAKFGSSTHDALFQENIVVDVKTGKAKRGLQVSDRRHKARHTLKIAGTDTRKGSTTDGTINDIGSDGT